MAGKSENESENTSASKNDVPPLDFALVLASSVHDMKNSVGMLLASLEEVIQETPPENEEQKRRFNTLHYESSRINNELVQLLTIYRMQNQFLPLRIDHYYVIDVMEEQVARNHMLLETGNIELDFQCDDELNWYYDNDLVSSVIHNIFVNCIRYTKSKIMIRAEEYEGYLCISIEDDGPGYPAHMLDKPSNLVENASDVADGGTHLGLYFAEQIAAMHKQGDKTGHIALENGGVYGGGVFRLFIP